MITGETGKDINIMTGAGSGDPMAMLMPYLASNSGGLGGNNGIWPIFLLALLAFSNNGLFGGRKGAECGVGGVGEASFLQLLNSVCSTKEAVSAASTANIAAIDGAADRVVGNNNVQAQVTNNNVAEAKANIAAVAASVNNGFANLAQSNCQSFAATNANITGVGNNLERSLFAGFQGAERTSVAGFADVNKSMACGFNTVNTNLFNGFAGVEKSLCQAELADSNRFNQSTAQNAAIMNELGKIECLINNSTEKVICSQQNLAKDAEIAALRAQLCDRERQLGAANVNLANINTGEQVVQSLRNSGLLIGGQGGAAV